MAGHERRAPERILAFTDAVVAIALTLLVLPLVDSVGELASRQAETLDDLVTPALLARVIAFAISFFVIARFWYAHHELMKGVDDLTTTLVILDFVWLFAIVFLPLPSAIIAELYSSAGATVLYAGTMLLSAAALLAMAIVAHRRFGEAVVQRSSLTGTAATALVFVVTILLALVSPVFGTWPLLALLITPPFERLALAAWNRRRPLPAAS